MTKIEIEDIKITEWIDASSRDGVKLIPTRMTLNAVIDGIPVSNIMMQYIPITSRDAIHAQIKQSLTI